MRRTARAGAPAAADPAAGTGVTVAAGAPGAAATGLGAETCPECGARFPCGAAAGEDDCWCRELPAVLPVPEADARCRCPACLARRIDAAPDR
jgi:hypothetical protein